MFHTLYNVTFAKLFEDQGYDISVETQEPGNNMGQAPKLYKQTPFKQ